MLFLILVIKRTSIFSFSPFLSLSGSSESLYFPCVLSLSLSLLLFVLFYYYYYFLHKYRRLIKRGEVTICNLAGDKFLSDRCGAKREKKIPLSIEVESLQVVRHPKKKKEDDNNPFERNASLTTDHSIQPSR